MLPGRSSAIGQRSLPGSTPPASAASRPARSTDDLPLPDGADDAGQPRAGEPRDQLGDEPLAPEEELGVLDVEGRQALERADDDVSRRAAVAGAPAWSLKTLAAMSSSAGAAPAARLRCGPPPRRRGGRSAAPRGARSPGAGWPRAGAAARGRARHRWPRRARPGRGGRPRARRPGVRSGRERASAARAALRAGAVETSRSSSPTHLAMPARGQVAVDRELEPPAAAPRAGGSRRRRTARRRRRRAAGRATGRVPRAGPLATSRSKRVTSSVVRPEPQLAAVPARDDRCRGASALRSCETCSCTSFGAVAGGGSAQSPSISRSEETVEPACSASIASSARGLPARRRRRAVDAGLHGSQETDVHRGPPADTTAVDRDLPALMAPLYRAAGRWIGTRPEGVPRWSTAACCAWLAVCLAALGVTGARRSRTTTGRSCSTATAPAVTSRRLDDGRQRAQPGQPDRRLAARPTAARAGGRGRKIVFISDRATPGNPTPPGFRGPDFEVFVMNADGSNPTQITFNDYETTAYPRGRRTAGVRCCPARFDRARAGRPDLFTIRADGRASATSRTRRCPTRHSDWSPDATDRLRERPRRRQRDLHDEAGRLARAPANGTRRPTRPSWSPTAAVAFDERSGPRRRDPGFAVDIYTMRADGGEQTGLTVGGLSDFRPTWSPDSRTIAFRPSAMRRSAGVSSTPNLHDARGRPKPTQPHTEPGVRYPPDWRPR